MATTVTAHRIGHLVVVVTPRSPGKPAGERRDLGLEFLRHRRERHKKKRRPAGRERSSVHRETKPPYSYGVGAYEKTASYQHGYRGALIVAHVHVSPQGIIRACKGCATAPAAVAQAMARARAIPRGGECAEGYVGAQSLSSGEAGVQPL